MAESSRGRGVGVKASGMVARLAALAQLPRGSNWLPGSLRRFTMKLPAFLTPAVRLLLAIALAAVLMLLAGLPGGHREPVAEATHLPGFLDGNATRCETFDTEFDAFFAVAAVIAAASGDPLIAGSLLGLALFLNDIPEPAWVWADPDAVDDPTKRFHSASGKVVTEDQVARIDFPALHDSHDFFFNIDVDPGQEFLLSKANNPNEEGGTFATEGDLATPTELHNEWEIGTFPDETDTDPERTYPKWAWPSLGDRAWVDGEWIYDCGHPSEITDTGDKLFRSELHPMRAVAAMRPQVRTLPGTGSTPVPATSTDLYIHGHAGIAVDALECGPHMIIDLGTCDPGDYPHRGMPIAEDYEFDICLPPLPFDKAALATQVEDGPGNTVTDPALAPVLAPMPVGAPGVDPCADPEYGPSKIHVTIPLEGSGVTSEDVYARRIHAGWAFPGEDLRHLKLTLNKMDLHSDKDDDPGDCECTFFYMNVDRAPNEWIRMSTFADGNMNDYDDDSGICCGDGEMTFTGAEFDFFVANSQPFTVRARGYDQDCMDKRIGEHQFAEEVLGQAVPNFDGFQLGLCYTPLPDGFCLIPGFDECGDNDGYPELKHTFSTPDYGVGEQDLTTDGAYELEVTIEEIPLAGTVEGSADLSLDKVCKPDDTVMAGDPITCTIIVQNSGPGLPTNVVVDDVLLTDVDPGDYTLDPPTFTFPGVGFSDPCEPIEEIPGGKEFRCEIGTVPVGGKAIITTHITSTESGDFNNLARVFTDSTDPNPNNNADEDGVHVVPVSDLSLDKSDDPDPLVAGTDITYTLDVTNNGPSTAANVVVEDFVPAGVSVVSVSGTGGASCVTGVPGDPSQPATCNFDSMAPGDTETMTLVVRVNPGIMYVVVDNARVHSDSVDPDNSNDVDHEETAVRIADLEIVKTSDADFYKSSPVISYTIMVTNRGPADALDVVVTDDLPIEKKDKVFVVPASICSRPPGGTLLTCNLGTIPAGGSRLIRIALQPKGARGLVQNTADVASATFDPNAANNSSTKEVWVGPLPR
jgi:uncharacterized repeat protein (TIGR01451 family)